MAEVEILGPDVGRTTIQLLFMNSEIRIRTRRRGSASARTDGTPSLENSRSNDQLEMLLPLDGS
jgi:hypothetical protein